MLPVHAARQGHLQHRVGKADGSPAACTPWKRGPGLTAEPSCALELHLSWRHTGAARLLYL